MIKYGFFNSVSGDRVYNAEDMNELTKGLISENGIFANVDDGFRVVPNSGMTIGVSSGRARVNGHWVVNDSIETLTLSPADATRNRYDAIVLRHSTTTRDVTLTVIEGTLATAPAKPNIVRDMSTYDICLAYVYVAKGATTIVAANINDTRLDSNVCGYIVGLVNQIDTSEFFAQMEAWEEQKKAEFETWFSALTEQLGVITHIEEYRNTIVGVELLSAFPIGINEYDSRTDVLIANINGVMLVEGVDYTISGTRELAMLNLNFGLKGNDNLIEIRVLKSVIGIS